MLLGLLLHGTFVDEFLIEIVLPLSIFGGLYWWSSRKERKKKKEAMTHDRSDQPPRA
jgi:preprotein translocase subunit YajC